MTAELLRLLAHDGVFDAPPGQEFQLASGGTSPTLVDCSQVLRSHEAMRYVADLLEGLFHWHTPSFNVVAGPALGADPIAAALVNRVPGLRWVSVRREPKGRGRDRSCITGPLRAGDRVLVVEDVLTTGASLHRAVEACRQQGALVLCVAVLVTRIEGEPLLEMARRFQRDGVRFLPLFTLSQLLAVRG